jgi:hypothetical protein
MHTPEDARPDDPFPEEHSLEEPDQNESAAESEPVETRGVGWIIVPAFIGAVIGALIGLVQATGPAPKGEVAATSERLLMGGWVGAAVGLIAGGVVGLLIWIAFPYKGRNPHAPQPEGETKKAEGAPEATDEHRVQPDEVGGEEGQKKF